MQLRLKTKITLLIALLVLTVVGVSAWLYIAALTTQAMRQTNNSAVALSGQVLSQAQNALADAARAGQKPASNQPEDLNDYLRDALEKNAALQSLIRKLGENPLVYELSIVDSNGTVLVSSDSSLLGHPALPRQPLSSLVNSSFLRQLLVIYGPRQTYDVSNTYVLSFPGQQTPSKSA